MMIAIGLKAIWLFDSVQFDDNAAKHQGVMKKKNKQQQQQQKEKKYKKQTCKQISKQNIHFHPTHYDIYNVFLSFW